MDPSTKQTPVTTTSSWALNEDTSKLKSQHRQTVWTACSHCCPVPPFITLSNPFLSLLRAASPDILYITQYEELPFSSFAQIKDDYTTNSHCLTYAFHFKRLGQCSWYEYGCNTLHPCCLFDPIPRGPVSRGPQRQASPASGHATDGMGRDPGGRSAGMGRPFAE